MHTRKRLTAALACAIAACGLLSALNIDDEHERWDTAQQEIADNLSRPLDDAYLRWETIQSGLADQDLRRRLALDRQDREAVDLNAEYAAWEAEKAAAARLELERKHDQAAAAGDQLAAAQADEAWARSLLAEAAPWEREDAELLVKQAEAARIAAEENKALADDAASHALGQAIDEARSTQAAKRQTLADRYAARAASQQRSFNAVPITERSVWTTQSTNLYAGPGIGYEVVGSVAAGVELVISASADQFWQTRDNQWIPQRLTSNTDPAGARPGGPPTTAPADLEANPYKWTTYVSNSNGQETVDQCAGGLTAASAFTKAMGGTYYAIHNYCNGLPILSLLNGDLVLIQGVGVYRVIDSIDVSTSAKLSDLGGLTRGDIYLQTCYSSSPQMRVVSLVSA